MCNLIRCFLFCDPLSQGGANRAWRAEENLVTTDRNEKSTTMQNVHRGADKGVLPTT